MKRKGALSVHELTAADELIAAFHVVAGQPVARDCDLGIRHEARPGAADEAAARRSDMVMKFRQWRNDLHETLPLRIAQDVLFAETEPRESDRKNRWRKGTSEQYVITAVRHFAALRGNTPRGAHDWKVRREAPTC